VPDDVHQGQGRPGRAEGVRASSAGRTSSVGGPEHLRLLGPDQDAWASVGVHLEHYTGTSWARGRAVSRIRAAAGDLVFYYGDFHHVGIYVGGGMIVHAPHTATMSGWRRSTGPRPPRSAPPRLSPPITAILELWLPFRGLRPLPGQPQLQDRGGSCYFAAAA
jgi:hypothetical protein